MPEGSSDTRQRRAVALLVAAIIAVALIGFVTGISPERYQAQRPEARQAPDAGEVPAARTHAELERNPWGSDPVSSGWVQSREGTRAVFEPATAKPKSAASLERALDERAQRRAFDGAPPVIPHPVRSGGAPECVACHQDGFALAGRRASPIPHRVFASCTQCHVSATPSLTLAEMPGATVGPAAVSSVWTGLPSPAAGEAAYAGAPPAVPHATWMREECESCHGPDGRAALQTPHPDRRSCLQCHPAVSERGSRSAR